MWAPDLRKPRRSGRDFTRSAKCCQPRGRPSRAGKPRPQDNARAGPGSHAPITRHAPRPAPASPKRCVRLAESRSGTGAAKLRNTSSVCCSGVSGTSTEPAVTPSLLPDSDAGSGFDQFSSAAGADRRLGRGRKEPRGPEQALKSRVEPTAPPVSCRSSRLHLRATQSNDRIQGVF